jgi:lipopolysaccharide export system permease protein
MSLLTRYLVREFLRLFALCLGGGVALYLVIDLFDRINIFIRYGADVKWVVLFLLYKIPLMVYQIVPATMMLAILLTLGLMTRNNEVLALRTSGIPVSRIAAPFLGIAMLVSLAAFLMNEFVVSPAYQRSEYIRRILIEGQVPFSMKVRDRIWFKGEEGFYRIASFLPAKKEMQGVTWFTVSRPFQLSKRVDATRAIWEEGRWVFYDVVERTFQSGELAEIARADRKSIDLHETPEDFEALRKETDEMPFRKLRRYIRKIESEGYDSTPYRVDLHVKVSFPVLNIITAFLGIPFALRLPRIGGLAAAAGMSLILGFTFWVLFAVTVSIGQTGLLPPLVAAWAANILFAALGIYLLLRVESQALH